MPDVNLPAVMRILREHLSIRNAAAVLEEINGPHPTGWYHELLGVPDRVGLNSEEVSLEIVRLRAHGYDEWLREE